MNGYFAENEDEIIQLILQGEAVCDCGALMNLEDDQFICPAVKSTTLESMRITARTPILWMVVYSSNPNRTFHQDAFHAALHIRSARHPAIDLTIEANLGL